MFIYLLKFLYKLVYNESWQDLKFNILAIENGESGLHRSLQNGTYISENKCWLRSV